MLLTQSYWKLAQNVLNQCHALTLGGNNKIVKCTKCIQISIKLQYYYHKLHRPKNGIIIKMTSAAWNEPEDWQQQQQQQKCNLRLRFLTSLFWLGYTEYNRLIIAGSIQLVYSIPKIASLMFHYPIRVNHWSLKLVNYLTTVALSCTTINVDM